MASLECHSYNFQDMNFNHRRLAAEYLRRQAKQLARQLDGVRAAEDIEFVHRARVASRRLRTALRMFQDAFRDEDVRRWRKAVRRITSSLGDARDRDVQIELLCAKLSMLTTKECFPGMARILVQLERDREQLQRHVVKAVKQFSSSNVLRQIRRTARKTLEDDRQAPQDVQSAEILEDIRRHVLRQIEALLDHQDSLANPEDRERHHSMRIAAKRLRYTLEISRPAFPAEIEGIIEAVKKLQSLLGEIHDCDVWMDHLDAFALRERARIRKLFGHPGRFGLLRPGIEHLRADRECQRQKTFGELLAYWGELERREIWNELRTLVGAAEPPAATSSESPPPLVPSAPSPDAPSGESPSEADVSSGQSAERKSLLTTGS